ncbi:MAG: SDR family NAD(P)-dependent oxidoreductase [Actinomycetota bacterium]|nr:SDR family NAD(P)-dependent oxidoreductase [Actinomycetota bacterium]
MPDLDGRSAVVTGASSGIGRATAVALARAGARVAVGARRVERVEALARELPGEGHLALALDVTEAASSNAFVEAVVRAYGRVDVLVNNAGLAIGRAAIADGTDEDDAVMWETNVQGLVRMTRLVLPHMEDWRGHVVNLGSWAGREAYTYGGMYVGSKFAVRALTYVLRKELVGRIRVTTVDPGMVGDTEFSDVRFAGDLDRKRAVYEGVRYLTPADVADCIVWAVTRPAYMNVDEIVVKPLQQASQDEIVRDEAGSPPPLPH